MIAKSSLSRRLLLMLALLVLVTTLSAGVPAYWLTRSQLERQAWAQVDAAGRATRSLYQAEQRRLDNLGRLLAQRPTLQRLLAADVTLELTSYLEQFRAQSQIDILLICQIDNTILATTLPLSSCPTADEVGFQILGGRPVLLDSQDVADADTGQILARAVTGRWLDGAFLQELAANTGVHHILQDGTQAWSSLIGYEANAELFAQERAERSTIRVDGKLYFAEPVLLPTTTATPMRAIIALPVANLVITENQALAILIASTTLVALLAIALGAFYIHRLTAPLEAITAAAEQIAQGNFATPLPVLTRGPSEVVTLTAALERSQSAMMQALAERSQARDWLSTVLESITEGVVTFDAQGNVTYFNRGAEMLTGKARGEVLGQPLNRVLPLAGEDGDALIEALPGPGESRQIAIATRAGTPLVLAVTGAPLSAHGENEIALVLRDVTEEEARRHLRSYFLASISHEFRTPLSTLGASLELLLDESENMSSAEMRELLKSSHLGLLSLQTLIDNLLESSSIEAGRFTIRKQRIAINQVITDALRVVQPMLERRRQPIVLTETTYLPPLDADPTRLVQVLVNLIGNASKYSPVGQTIDLILEPRGDKMRIAVADRGPGIPASERAHLFRRFVRLNARESEQYGIGLGLYVVKKIVDAHGGEVGVDERAGGGSVFWFELPLAASGPSDFAARNDEAVGG